MSFKCLLKREFVFKFLGSTRTFARGHTAVLRALLRLRCHDDINYDVAVTLFMLLAMMFFVRLMVLFAIISVVWTSR